ncbi:MAG: hypothetical protein MUE60_15950, partial [Candidatus Eisenbacteria bacterium]|nr:hypothetical protein [Candidatus Eisenbacteria bacterium]
PSDEDLDRVMVAKRMQRATAEDFAARQRLSKATNASVNGVPLAIRALNLLLESNVEIPEDMKAAMAEFMDASDEAVRAAHQHALVRDEYMEKNAYVEG